MTDRDGPGDPPATAPAIPGDAADRRSFLRSLPGSALRTAEQLVGLSSIMRRSVVAVGETLIRDGEPRPAEIPPAGDAAGPGATATLAGPAATPAVTRNPPEVPAVAPTPPPARDPVADLTPEQHAFLGEGTGVVIAANDPAGAPHLTSSPYAWDGTIFRVPGRMSSARAIAIDRDPRVSLLLGRADSEAWVAVTGLASLGPIERVESETLEILAASLGPESAAARWREMQAMGDAIVIHVRPTRFVWRTA